jgi:hypothetical protein
MKATAYNKRFEKVKQKAFENREREVAPVAKDTNKTRRKPVKPTKLPDAK